MLCNIQRFYKSTFDILSIAADKIFFDLVKYYISIASEQNLIHFGPEYRINTHNNAR